MSGDGGLSLPSCSNHFGPSWLGRGHPFLAQALPAAAAPRLSMFTVVSAHTCHPGRDEGAAQRARSHFGSSFATGQCLTGAVASGGVRRGWRPKASPTALSLCCHPLRPRGWPVDSAALVAQGRRSALAR